MENQLSIGGKVFDIFITSCDKCPFANNDNEFGRDCCNLAEKLGSDFNDYFNLPVDSRHKDCPIDNYKK